MANLAFVLVSVLLSARVQTNTGLIQGTVISAETKKPVPNVSIQILKSRRKAKTNSEGEFVFKDVPAGTYDFEITSPDFVTFRYSGFTVKADSVLTLNISLFNPPSSHKPRVRIVTPDTSVHYKMRYVPIPRRQL